MKILQAIKLNGLTGVAVVALIIGCSSMSGDSATNEKLTVERIDSQNAQITSANVQEDSNGLKVRGSLKTKPQRRNKILGICISKFSIPLGICWQEASRATIVITSQTSQTSQTS